jgi:hypothetical protein
MTEECQFCKKDPRFNIQKRKIDGKDVEGFSSKKYNGLPICIKCFSEKTKEELEK